MIAWFVTTTVGKALLKWTGIAAIVAAGYWRIYASGKAAAEAERVADELNARKDKDHLDDNVRKMDDTALDRELSRWVRD
ncbi:hypothetical protein AWN88_22485 [Agrobacterium tumefaciens]|nr:hypothetical protein AWN88_22485 [Agrobacterium tumefaciens]KAJ35045.1 hypothetical protein BW45_00260 [Agrobacterium tumefaciens]